MPPSADVSAASLPPDLEEEVSAFLDASFRLQDPSGSSGSAQLSLAAVKLLRRLVGQAPWQNAAELLHLLRRRILQAGASATLPGNLTRRVMKLVREEHAASVRDRGGAASDLATVQTEAAEEESLHRMVAAAGGEDCKKSSAAKEPDLPRLKSRILDAMDELQTEIESSSEEIANQALEHIHSSEVILTVGRSRTVEFFLQQAAKERKFQVIVAECAPFFRGHEMAANLAKCRIQTTVIPDSAVLAMMSRVNKVIVGTHTILADGGLKAPVGTYTAALAASHYAVPLYVCAGIAKLTPVYCTSLERNFGEFVSPAETLRGMDGEVLAKIDNAATPVFEYVPPELVTLFVSNISGHAPSYVYRLLSELYHPKDYDMTVN